MAAKKTDCPACGGTGKRQVRYTEPETTCPECNGTGKVAAAADDAAEPEAE